MKLDTQISGYYLRKQGSYYIYSDENSRDVFYFDECAEPLLSVPIFKQSIDSILPLYPIHETNIPVQLNAENKINLDDAEDELPF